MSFNGANWLGTESQRQPAEVNQKFPLYPTSFSSNFEMGWSLLGDVYHVGGQMVALLSWYVNI